MSFATTTTMTSSPSSTHTHLLDSRVVRFDNECVLIPEHERVKRPIIITKSYSLPLWKRKPSTSEDEAGEECTSPTTEVVFKVPLPGFLSRPSKSPTRGRQCNQPLSPCLVHRSPSSPPQTENSLRERRPSQPSPTFDYAGKPLMTIPLRACCQDCVPITEESLKEGDLWVEKFTRGARRRRASSADSASTSLVGSPGSDAGFAAVTASNQGRMEAAIVSARFPCTPSISVDEVDKRRRSRDLSLEGRLGPIGVSSNDSRGQTRTTNLSTSQPNSPTILVADYPIEEEDEDQLFPLPSPRRTPNASPANSANVSPVPSPNASTTQLMNCSGSRELITEHLSSEEGIIRKSLTRKDRIGIGPQATRSSPQMMLPPVARYHTHDRPDSPLPGAETLLSKPHSHVHSHSHSYSLHEQSDDEFSVKKRRPSFSATVLRTGADILKGVSLTTGATVGT